MPALPPPDTQAWLLDALADLIDQLGPQLLLEAPIRLPTEADFPDPWAGDIVSLERLCRRLLGYAGLGERAVRLEVFEGDRSVDHVDLQGRASYRHHGAAAWFAGIDDREVRFGCATRQLDEGGEALVGVMCHEVAHAWRHAHRLDVPDRDTEELLTDLSTIFLGFGVFTVNNTLRYRTEVFEDGPMAGSRYTTSSAGYLAPVEMSFLFATQLQLRRLGFCERRRLLGWLEPNQRGFVRAAMRHLQPDALAARLLDRPEPPPITTAR